MEQIKCPNCGATVMTELTSGKIKCEYCGSSFKIQEHNEFQMPQTNINSALKTPKAKRVIRTILCTFGALFILTILLVIIAGIDSNRRIERDMEDYRESLEKIDPFEDVQFEFLGKNGNGRCVVKNTQSDIYYSPRGNGGLHNGDRVIVEASAYNYNLTRDKIEVVVEGLLERVKDPNEISDEDLAIIGEFSKKELAASAFPKKNSPYESKDSVEILDRVEVTILSNDEESILYDVYRIKWNSYSGETLEAYCVAELHNVYIWGDGKVDISWQYVKGPYMHSEEKGIKFENGGKYDRPIHGYWDLNDLHMDYINQDTKMDVKTRTFE